MSPAWPWDKAPRTKKDMRLAMAEQGWRLNNLYRIKNKDGREIPFRMNWAQQEYFRELWFRSLILKARQLGFSTFINLLQLDTCLFVPNTACGIVAHNEESAKELFRDHIKFPYEHLPESLASAIPTARDSAHQYEFTNGSSIRVATSMRGGTLQILHVSEFGKICAQYPIRAKEVVTGSLETVSKGNIAVIESTAEGAEGYFHDYCQQARALQQASKKLSPLDYRFFFFPWWKEPSYVMEPGDAIITPELRKYFIWLAGEIDRELTQEQQAWYAVKFRALGDDMWREYPSTPDEAFKASIEGAYYSIQIAAARRDGRIGRVPALTNAPINTFWDLGVDDYTSIWLHQRVGLENRLVGYYESCGEGLSHYANWLWSWKERGYTFGLHHFPHDAANRSLAHKDGKSAIDTASDLGLRPNVIVQTSDLLGGIQATRDILSSCWFDEIECATGIERLAKYRKEWNSRLGCFASYPRHDENSHGADAFRMLAQGYRPPIPSQARRRIPTQPADAVAGY